MNRSKMVIVCLTSCIIVGLFMVVVGATNLGGKWNTNSVLYYAGSTDPYSGQDVQGKTNWNNVTTHISYSRVGLLSAVVASVYGYYGSTGWNATGVPGPVPTSGTYTYGTLTFNRTYMDSYSTNKRTAIACHESGHILGLAHNNYFDSDSSKRSIMYYGGSSIYFDQWGLTGPTSIDTSDINALYP